MALRRRLLDAQLCELRYRAGDGRGISLPVLYAAAVALPSSAVAVRAGIGSPCPVR
ncbi:hypothetical protein GA0070613_1261 [Micromonospora inositola]|uniref:Uncharacterized protein n=1 Tax=Micromonospora inositola TaxID=47865 RepID=A0A1C5HFV7_9ACTN|nr:hypothetical protein GA0070613_1261 [Micromonospora inositola]